MPAPAGSPLAFVYVDGQLYVDVYDVVAWLRVRELTGPADVLELAALDVGAGSWDTGPPPIEPPA